MSRTLAEHFAVFEAERNPLEDIRAFVQAALLETALDRKTVAGLMLAVEEAVTNIIRHGYLYGPGKIRVRVRRSRCWVSIILSDTGRPYTIDTGSAPDARQLADTGRKGGLGVYLIRKVTDRQEYRRVNGENTLVMSKRIHRAMGEPLSRSSLRRRVAWTGVLAVTVLVLAGAWVIQRQAVARVKTAFFERWDGFGRMAAAAASQHILNNRSDAEFDQLVVDLKAAHPGLERLVILSGNRPGAGSPGSQIIRAHSESPERVHEVYRSPRGVPVGGEGHWLLGRNGDPAYHFSQRIKIDNRVLGSVAWDVPRRELTALIATARTGVIQWAALAMGGGIILVLLGSAWMARPLLKLVETLSSSRSQSAEPPLSSSGPEEIRQVMAAFRDATTSVARSERQIAERDLARREIEASRQLQRALLPERLPEVPGYEFAATCRMARQVGGDYYDVIPLDAGHWMVIVADVAGKGLPAALVMMALRTATRLLARAHPSPKALLAALHRYLVDNHPSGPFITVCCAMLDTAEHRIEIASAGHTPALLKKQGASGVRQINPRGRPIGLHTGPDDDFSERLESETITVGPGDHLLFFTDGLVDTRTGGGELYGFERVEKALVRHAERSPRELVTAILQDADRFCAGNTDAANDDLTLLSLQRINNPVAPGTQAARQPVQSTADELTQPSAIP